VLHVVRGDEVVGAVALEDAIRIESRQAADGSTTSASAWATLTGDARQVADAVGTVLGIDEVFAEVLPEDKHHAVAELQDRGLQVPWSVTV
jgi:P-type Cu2+ transporter